MCGICGIIETDGHPVNKDYVQRMVQAIIHRGPDGNAVKTAGAVGIGHCRLSILDLSQDAAQPMSTEDGLFSITYNGEMYNFEEVRRDLQRLGHVFHSRSDTEVVLRAYAQWGRACVERFNGMFAFAVVDYKRQRLFLARDRYGIKPLYYTFCGSTLLFASEHKAFLTHPTFSAKVDPAGLMEYFTFQNLFSGRTLLHNVNIFPAGCHAYMSLQGERELHIKRYWDYDFREDPTLSDPVACREELDRLFRQAIERQLISDVEIGSYLSGGMDSGSITALAARRFPYIKTFTCGFDLNSASGLELSFDERRSAEFMSYLFKTEHYEMVLKAGDMERVLPKVAWHIEEPRVGQSYPNYCIANLASRFVKVALAGTGGDELFGGYPWRYYRTLGATSFDDYVDRYYQFWQRLLPNTELRAMFAPLETETRHVWTRDIFRDVFGHTIAPQSPEECINMSLYFEAKTFMHGLLVVDDKLSMAHGLETRVPFLDNDLVDFAQRLPVRMKLRDLDNVLRINENETAKQKMHFLKTNDGKAILRETMQRYIPQSVTDALKQGFSAPDASWFKGDSINYVQKILFSDKARLYDYLDKQVVRRHVQQHLDGKANQRLLIWSLLNFEHWLKAYLP
jgi:asparagine synthase (glutamine-hydrolyzing)